MLYIYIYFNIYIYIYHYNIHKSIYISPSHDTPLTGFPIFHIYDLSIPISNSQEKGNARRSFSCCWMASATASFWFIGVPDHPLEAQPYAAPTSFVCLVFKIQNFDCFWRVTWPVLNPQICRYLRPIHGEPCHWVGDQLQPTQRSDPPGPCTYRIWDIM